MCYYCENPHCKECAISQVTSDHVECEHIMTCEMLSTLAVMFHACEGCYNEVRQKIAEKVS